MFIKKESSMATKKPAPVQKGKAPVKAAANKTVKPAPKKVAPPAKAAPAPAKKATVKPAAKPVAKPAPAKTTKPAPAPAKKTVAPVKKATAPVPKANVKKAAAPKPAAKPAAAVKSMPKKEVIKKEVPAKAAPAKVAPAKAAAPVKPVAPAKPAAVAPSKVAAKGKSSKPSQIKAEIKKSIIKPAGTSAAAKEASKPILPILPVKQVVPTVKPKEVKPGPQKPVVIPKITTKTVKKYEPEFTKSVLDKAQAQPQGPSQRYSDMELEEFRELIQRKLEAAKKELNYLQGLITRKDELGGDEGDNRYMTMEDGSLSMEREQLSQMASRQITFIDHLEKAIMRIENKTYGICRVTGKLIDKARLRAVPHATLSIEAKMGNVK
jgi:RNA polymerase-binding transcription factor DksA